MTESSCLFFLFISPFFFFFFQAEDGIRDWSVTGVPDVCSSDLSVSAAFWLRARTSPQAEACGYQCLGGQHKYPIHPSPNQCPSNAIPPPPLTTSTSVLTAVDIRSIMGEG